MDLNSRNGHMKAIINISNSWIGKMIGSLWFKYNSLWTRNHLICSVRYYSLFIVVQGRHMAMYIWVWGNGKPKLEPKLICNYLSFYDIHNFTASVQVIALYNEFKNHIFRLFNELNNLHPINELHGIARLNQ